MHIRNISLAGELPLFISCLVLLFAAETQAQQQPTSMLYGRVVEHDRRFEFTTEKWKGLPGQTSAKNLAAGDFNGDGLADVAAFIPSDNAVTVMLSRRSDFAAQRWRIGETPQWSALTSGDLDADGRDDLVGLTDEGSLRAYLSNGVDEFTALALNVELPILTDTIITNLDRNCDGRADIIIWDRASQRFYNLASRKNGLRLRENAQSPAQVQWVFGGIFEENSCGGFLFAHSPPGRISRWTYTFNDRRQRTWAEFDSRPTWSGAVAGDFSGDGLTDLLVYASGPLPGWWAAIANGRTGIESFAGGPPQALSQDTAVLAGDFNGDGFDDLLTVEEADKAFKVHLTKPGPGIAEATVASVGGGTVLTDRNGSFALPVRGDSETVRVEAQGFTLSRAQRVISPAQAARPVNFVGYRTLSGQGRNEQFGPPPEGPFICISYNPGAEFKWGHAPLCPDHYAVLGASAIKPSHKSPDVEVRVLAYCCKLPAEDILTAEEVWSDAQCPDGFVATGSEPYYGCEECPKRLRCTKINEQRYQLGRPADGVYWGAGFSLKREPRHIHPSAIPLALRYAFGRDLYASWIPDGCVAEHPGHLLTAKRQGGCAGLSYRELQYRGLPGDPPAGTAVTMYPPCTKLENVYDALGGCTTAGRSN